MDSAPAVGRLQSLPPELSVQILKICVPRVMDRKGRHLFLAHRALCSQWREICFKTPEFWSTLSIDFSDETGMDDDETLKEFLQSAQAWLNRAGDFHQLELSAVGLWR
ncbi:hypothetical protein BKA70DRAFT_692230 [Coprinopsis sp. MPI-PUGE-AT-0042]|nr:hypothetical protein BKA70DRAFT_692230 [Coprinopsis sp. MPI-PUGE-AT-0042]